jgi:hypothetical protein
MLPTPGELYALLDGLAAFRRAYGRGRTPEAAHARQACAFFSVLSVSSVAKQICIMIQNLL